MQICFKRELIPLYTLIGILMNASLEKKTSKELSNAIVSDRNLGHLYALLVRVKAPISSCCMCMARMCASGSVGCLLPLSPSIRQRLSLFKNTCNKDTKQISLNCCRKDTDPINPDLTLSAHIISYYTIDQRSKLSLT